MMQVLCFRMRNTCKYFCECQDILEISKMNYNKYSELAKYLMRVGVIQIDISPLIISVRNFLQRVLVKIGGLSWAAAGRHTLTLSFLFHMFCSILLKTNFDA